ncbi:Cyclin-dependent kinase 2 like protein [Plasmodiophora brassicae]
MSTCPYASSPAHKRAKSSDAAPAAPAKGHPNLNGVPSVQRCPAYGKGCPFSSENGGHAALLSKEDLEVVRQKCPAWNQGCCPFSNNNDMHPKITSMALVHLCPNFKETKSCPFAGASHPDISKFVGDIKTCPVFSGHDSCPFKKSAVHPSVDEFAAQIKKCPAFAADCPFKPNSQQTIHKGIKFSEALIAYLREVCPAFKDERCPLDKYKSFSEMDLRKCPAFSESCPFDAKKSKYPKLAQLANVGNCKAFAAGCPFKPERQEHESCPVLAGWHEALHPPVHALDNVAHDCIAFKQQAGCPFREASSDKDHRMMGMIDGALDVIKEKCPAWSAGTCPFSKDSNAHPEITSAAQVADCPAFKGKSCVFNAASPPTDAHPNIAYLFTKSVKDCSAFTGGCPFAALGRPFQAPQEAMGRALKSCPAFVEAHGCPFKQLKTSAQLFEKFASIPSTHYEMLQGDNDFVSKMLKATRLTSRVPAADPASILSRCSSTASSSSFRCPMSGKKRKEPSTPKYSHDDFAKLFAHFHHKDSDASPLLKDTTPIKEMLQQCPAFSLGKCPFAA